MKPPASDFPDPKPSIWDWRFEPVVILCPVIITQLLPTLKPEFRRGNACKFAPKKTTKKPTKIEKIKHVFLHIGGALCFQTLKNTV